MCPLFTWCHAQAEGVLGAPLAVRQAWGHPSPALVKGAHTLSARGVSARIKWILPRKESRFIL